MGPSPPKHPQSRHVTDPDGRPPQFDFDELQALATKAAERILSVYRDDFDVMRKADDSPVTRADQEASRVITEALTRHSQWPVLSEENTIPPWSVRQQWHTYWLVDPLDGTKEFVKKNGDFSVNVALVHEHRPVQGLILAPVSGECWWAAQGTGAWYCADVFAQTTAQPIQVAPIPSTLTDWQALHSRSHQSAKTRHFRALLGVADEHWRAVGSSLKMCHIAQGKAHLYARLGPTCEWDTAAAQIILEEAGGLLINAETGYPMRYNHKESLLNPWFVAASGPDERWQAAITDTLAWARKQH